ncbi:MAG: hypothetical protein DRI61_17600, partial [Chloroflexi bacterium]
EGSIYRMWYDGEQEIGDQGEELVRIGYAYSLDGILWTKYIGNPVIFNGGPGDFDEQSALDPMVIKDGNTYKMWYSGEGNCVGWDCDTAFGYATSPAYPQNAYLDIELMSVSVYDIPTWGTGLILMMYPAGPGPLDINEMKVTGPGNFSYTFSDSDIRNVYSNNRIHQFPAAFTWAAGGPGTVQAGDYTFTVTANSGVSVSDSLYLSGTTAVPIPQDGTGAGQLDRFIEVSGVTYENQSYISATTPTFKWKPSSGTTYYYRVFVRDWTTRAIWHVGPYQDGTQTVGGYMSDTLAAGTLKENTPYKWQVEAIDTDNVWSACARSRSGYYDFYTGTKSGTSDYLQWVNVQSERSTYGGERTLTQAGVYNLAPWDIDTTTGGQEFRVEKSGGTPFPTSLMLTVPPILLKTTLLHPVLIIPLLFIFRPECCRTVFRGISCQAFPRTEHMIFMFMRTAHPIMKLCHSPMPEILNCRSWKGMINLLMTMPISTPMNRLLPGYPRGGGNGTGS